MKCRHCESTNIDVNKCIFKNKTFHIIVQCFDCRKRYHAPRNKEAYELTKDKIWIVGGELKKLRKDWKNKNKKNL